MRKRKYKWRYYAKKMCSPSGEQRGIRDNLGNKVISEDEVENLFGLTEPFM